MAKNLFLKDNEWPIEARKKVLKTLPANIYDCIHKVVTYAKKADAKEPPTLQTMIEQCIFQTKPDRKFPMNPLIYFKALNVIAAAFVFDLETVQSRRKFFTCLFLGRESNALGDPAAHDSRMSGLIRFSSVALQYPMPSFFDILAEWLLKDVKLVKYITLIAAEICNGYLLRPQEYEMNTFIEPLESRSFEFSAIVGLYFINRDYLTEPIQVISIIGKWYNKRCIDFLDFYSKYPNLATEFASKRFPIMIEYDCNNGKSDEIHEMFHAAVIKLIIASQTKLAGTPLDLSYLINLSHDSNAVNQERRSECYLVASSAGYIPAQKM